MSSTSNSFSRDPKGGQQKYSYPTWYRPEADSDVMFGGVVDEVGLDVLVNCGHSICQPFLGKTPLGGVLTYCHRVRRSASSLSLFVTK